MGASDESMILFLHLGFLYSPNRIKSRNSPRAVHKAWMMVIRCRWSWRIAQLNWHSHSGIIPTLVMHNSSNIPIQQAQFQERRYCISCGGNKFEIVWSGRFCEEPTRSHLQRCFYNGDVISTLADESFYLVKCNSCNQLFHRRILTSKWLRILYSQWINDLQIERFEKTHLGNERKRRFEQARQLVKHVLRLQELIEPSTDRLQLLDYGCGDGMFLTVAAIFGFKYHGVDFSISRAERARHHGITILPSLDAFDALQTGPVDVVTLFEVLEHVDQPLELLSNLHQRLKKRGMVIVEVPDCRGVKNGDSFEDFHRIHVLEHINAFTPNTLKAMFSRAGFCAIRRKPAHVTTRSIDLFRTELSRVVQPSSTAMYFRKIENWFR